MISHTDCSGQDCAGSLGVQRGPPVLALPSLSLQGRLLQEGTCRFGSHQCLARNSSHGADVATKEE